MRTLVLIPAILAAALYLAGAVYTSGLVWNRYDCSDPNNYGCDEQQLIASVVATALWPFTVSAAYHGGWLK
jgi:hypothetical protein